MSNGKDNPNTQTPESGGNKTEISGKINPDIQHSLHLEPDAPTPPPAPPQVPKTPTPKE